VAVVGQDRFLGIELSHLDLVETFRGRELAALGHHVGREVPPERAPGRADSPGDGEQGRTPAAAEVEGAVEGFLECLAEIEQGRLPARTVDRAREY